jgi:hypothetical protein
VRGRKQERSILMGWPDDHVADLHRDDWSLLGAAGKVGAPDPHALNRDPQEGSWDE